jgi:hypothetical protein
MILDMIQGCRYLRKVDGSMAPLEELDDSTRRTQKLAQGRFVEKLFDPSYKH